MKSKEKSVMSMTVNSPHDNKERKVSCPFVGGKLLHCFSKNKFYHKVSGSALLLLFRQVSGLCSYKKEEHIFSMLELGKSPNTAAKTWAIT